MAAGNRGLISLWARICAVITCGCAVAAGTACCGITVAPRVSNSAISPATLQVGGMLHCQAEVRGSTPNTKVVAEIERRNMFSKPVQLTLFNDGKHGDQAAGDDVWAADWPWDANYGVGSGIQVRIVAQETGSNPSIKTFSDYMKVTVTPAAPAAPTALPPAPPAK